MDYKEILYYLRAKFPKSEFIELKIKAPIEERIEFQKFIEAEIKQYGLFPMYLGTIDSKNISSYQFSNIGKITFE